MKCRHFLDGVTIASGIAGTDASNDEAVDHKVRDGRDQVDAAFPGSSVKVHTSSGTGFV
jgi:hypothetical protein